jgi:hypothetical protein
MTVRLVGDTTIELDGVCPIEDADVLLQHLLAAPFAAIDWRSCDGAHTSVVQLMLVSKAELIGPPRSKFLRNVIESALVRKSP